jgi:hypothetical protein
MKYRTFRNLLTLGGIVLLLGLCGLCGTCARLSGTKSYRNTPPPPVARTTPTPAPSSTPAPSDTGGLRRVDKMIVDYIGFMPAMTDKHKDLFPRESFKVNIYRDGDSQTWTRVKIDLDRDNKDDEKWTLAGKQPDKRQVSTRDDEQYDREYRWQGGQWVEKSK